MFQTIEQRGRFLASCEMCYDPMYQPSMDEMYHQFMQPKWEYARSTWPKIVWGRDLAKPVRGGLNG